CRAELDVGAVDVDVAALDDIYERDDGPPVWRELHPVTDDERVVRATLTLEGDRLVVETQSEPRMDRVLDRLEEVLPGVALLDDERTPLDVATMRRLAEVDGGSDLAPPPMDPDARAFLEEHRSTMEERWC